MLTVRLKSLQKVHCTSKDIELDKSAKLILIKYGSVLHADVS